MIKEVMLFAEASGEIKAEKLHPGLISILYFVQRALKNQGGFRVESYKNDLRLTQWLF